MHINHQIRPFTSEKEELIVRARGTNLEAIVYKIARQRITILQIVLVCAHKTILLILSTKKTDFARIRFRLSFSHLYQRNHCDSIKQAK